MLRQQLALYPDDHEVWRCGERMSNSIIYSNPEIILLDKTHKRTSVIYTRRDVVFNEQDFGHAKQVTIPKSVEVLSEVREQEPHSDPAPEPNSEPEKRNV